MTTWFQSFLGMGWGWFVATLIFILVGAMAWLNLKLTKVKV